ncbi:MAG: 16S rRNA (adenine(1518)-N(6)/adenine(1519)-N(6))-dimethyltransferase RsmA [Cyanobacteria bacterium]|nr:16S rRNA (adenine(1518)-N(6)/adenine(1519)-N(6))-dimethyltransferase RsmA [Cyanobacteriota bacterium]
MSSKTGSKQTARQIEALQAVQEALYQEAKRLRLKKRFSQNFLVNPNDIAAIVKALNASEQDNIVEIGPGSGFLTREILKTGCNLLAIDVDPRMIAYLKESLLTKHPNLQIQHHDILKFDLNNIEWPKFQVVGNLPYNITTPIVFKLIGELSQSTYPLREKISQITLLVQKEVAERLASGPNHPQYNALSISVQYWYEVKIIHNLPASHFYPKPKVDSALVQLIPRLEPRRLAQHSKTLSKIIRAAFSQRRKTIQNTLIHGSIADSRDKAEALLSEAGILPSQRAQEISIEQFEALTDAYLQRQPDNA